MQKGASEIESVDELKALTAYDCEVRRNKEGAIMGKLQAVKFYHE